MRPLIVLFLPLLIATGAFAQVKTLPELEKVAQELNVSRNPFQDNDKRIAFQEDLVALVNADGLKSGEEFRRAGLIVNSINAGFDEARLRHELMLVGMVLGDAEAAKQLKSTWDQFLLKTGRQQHIGTVFGYPGVEDDTFRVNPTVACVRTVFLDPLRARQDVKGLATNKEFRALVTEDQKVREGDWSKLSSDQMKAIYVADIQRRRRLKGLLGKIKLMTAQDYADGALVMQHGSRFDDYALAHELALCATILDPKAGRQLVALTWDRMLESGGYRQRVGTQYHGMTLSKVDSDGFNDTMRKALGRQALADIPKKFGR